MVGIGKRIQTLLRKRGLRIYKEHWLPSGTDWTSDVRRIGLSESPVVFDVGANIGQTSVLLSEALPTAHIYAFEPFSGAYSQLVRNTKHLTNVHTYALAFGSQGRALSVKLHERSDMNSLVDAADIESRSTECGSEVVKVETVARFCESNGIDSIDVLKCDTEGYEMEVLSGAEPLLDKGRVSFVYAEVTFCAANARNTSFFSVFEYLTARSYRFLGTYETYAMHNFPMPNVFCNVLFMHPSARQTPWLT
jgi:FkbM family methyltransferase